MNVQRFLQMTDWVSDALGISVPPVVEMERLRSLPVGSFGRAWADALDQQHLTPFTTGPRRKQLHDGIHILTGYGTDPLGEAEVQAFLLGAKFSPIQIILGAGLLRMLYCRFPSQIDLQQVWTRLWQAYQRGQQSGFDVDAWQVEQFWELSLKDARTQLGL